MELLFGLHATLEDSGTFVRIASTLDVMELLFVPRVGHPAPRPWMLAHLPPPMNDRGA